MYRKVTYLESRAVEAFLAFVQYRCTQCWFNGVEIGQASYKGKPSDGDRRVVTIWQGSKSSYHQKLEVHFFYVEEFGGWNINGFIFSGTSHEPGKGDYKWLQAFRGGRRFDNTYSWHFVPARFDGRYFQNYDLRETDQNDEFTQACKGRFPRLLPN
jgi:hypothetical protein